MNNLHRELAPISSQAWEEIEEEVLRTFKRNLGGRRVVDLSGPHGATFSSVGTGHLKAIEVADSGLHIRQHQVVPLLQLRVPFELNREEIDAVEFGSQDSDWQPAKEAAEKLAYAEDRTIFEGLKSTDIEGMRTGTTNPVLTLPHDPDDYPEVIAEALKQLRLVGVDGPYIIIMGAEAYTKLIESSDDGYPVISHIRRLVEHEVVWAPAIQGAFVLSARGGDFELSLGRDLSIGYQSHTDKSVKLYLEETMTFRLLTPEAVVAIEQAPVKVKK
ncbi:MAG: family 1 encapsulin nanocompartment shell protein [Saezia sp.]